MITEELTVVAMRLSQYRVEADLASPLLSTGIVPELRTRFYGIITVVGDGVSKLELGQKIRVTLEPAE